MPDTFLTTRFTPAVYLNNPQGGIVLEDIEEALGRIPRFSGHADWSVLQHTCLVQAILSENNYITDEYPGAHLWALIHDASEAYLGDMPKPVFDHLTSSARAEISALHEKFTNAILDTLGLKRSDVPGASLITEPDLLALHMEAETFFPHRPQWDIDTCPFLQDWARPWMAMEFLISGEYPDWPRLVSKLAEEVKENQ